MIKSSAYVYRCDAFFFFFFDREELVLMAFIRTMALDRKRFLAISRAYARVKRKRSFTTVAVHFLLPTVSRDALFMPTSRF